MINNKNKILHKELSYKIQGLIFGIRNELGSGHKESIYQKALERELTNSKVEFKKEPAIKIYSSKGEYLGLYRPDFLIEDKIIVELKATKYITRQESSRVYDYLRNSKYELSYLVNFASPRLYTKRLIFTNDRKKAIPKLALFVAISLLFVAISGLPSLARAAQIFFGYHSKEVGLNEKFEVGVFLNTQNEFINAVEGTIIFPPDLLEFQGVHNGGSILTLWVKQPYVKSDGKVVFSGVAPGGFVGNKGYLFSLIFKVKQKGQITISATNEKILLNDGTGTKASLTKAPLVLSIVEKNSLKTFVPLYDSNPPEAFQLYVAKDQNIFSGKWFLSFDAQDKESGIDHYEISEKPQPNSIFTLPFLKKEEWIKGQSPYLLKDQSLKSVISVKAFDRAKNITIAMLPANNKMAWYENFVNWFIIIAIGLSIAFFVFLLRKFLWRIKY